MSWSLRLRLRPINDRRHRRHTWQPIESQNGQHTDTGADVSMVLLRCTCGEFRTRMVDGHWTVAQLGGVS